MWALKIVVFALFVAVSLGDEIKVSETNEKANETTNVDVKDKKARGHYGYGDYYDDYYDDDWWEDDYDDGYWYGYEPFWPSFFDSWGHGGHGRRHHHHHRGRGGRGRSSSSSSSSSSSESKGRSRESSGRDDDSGDRSKPQCPRPRPSRIHKACSAVKIGSKVTGGALQAEVGPVAHGGSVEIKCNGGLVLKDNSGNASNVRVKCHDGHYKPSLDSDKVKQLRCEALPKCLPPRKVFLPVEDPQFRIDRTDLVSTAPETDPQPVGAKVTYKCTRKDGNLDSPLAEYQIWFYDVEKGIMENPTAPREEPSLTFTCNSQGIWETFASHGQVIFPGTRGAPYPPTPGYVSYGNVACGNYDGPGS